MPLPERPASLRARTWAVLRGRPRTWIAIAATLALLLPLGWMWKSSLLPDSYDMAEMGYADWGGGPVDEHHGMGHGIPVKDLVEDPQRVVAELRKERVVIDADEGVEVEGA